MSKLCTDCGSLEVVVRKCRCRDCHNAYNRTRYHLNPNSLIVRKALYLKHAAKRRAESALRKLENRERYSLLEWFRKKGIPASELDSKDLDALVEMKKALKPI